MTRRTLYRDAPGGHYPDCIVSEAGEVLLCHCTPPEVLVSVSRPARALRVAYPAHVARDAQPPPARQHPLTVPLADYRADPLKYERMVTPDRPLRVVDEDGKVYATSSVDAPEPAAFCSPLELDGDPPPSRLSVRGVLLTVAVVLTVCVAWSWLVAS